MSHAQAGDTSPSSTCSHHKATAARSGQPQHKAGAVPGTGGAAHLSVWKDELTHMTGEVVHTQRFFSCSVFPMTLGDREGTGTHTHTSKNQSLQAKPVLCSFLVAQVAGLAFRGNRSPNQRWFCQESFRSGCPPDRMVLTTAELITPTALSFCNRNLFSVKYRQS